MPRGPLHDRLDLAPSYTHIRTHLTIDEADSPIVRCSSILAQGGTARHRTRSTAASQISRLARFRRAMRGRWFDVVNVSYRSVAEFQFASTDQESFVAPGRNIGDDRDWVLLLDAGP